VPVAPVVVTAVYVVVAVVFVGTFSAVRLEVGKLRHILPAALVGYGGQVGMVAPGEEIALRLFWGADAPTASPHNLFVHLTAADDPTAIIAQVDGAPALPTRPTTSWDDPDEVLVSDVVRLTVPADAAPGDYTLRLGLYDYQTYARLPLADGADAFTIPVAVTAQ